MFINPKFPFFIKYPRLNIRNIFLKIHVIRSKGPRRNIKKKNTLVVFETYFEKSPFLDKGDLVK